MLVTTLMLWQATLWRCYKLQDQFIELMDKEIVIVTKESITIKNLQGETIERAPFTAELDASDIEKEHILISCLKKSMSNHL